MDNTFSSVKKLFLLTLLMGAISCNNMSAPTVSLKDPPEIGGGTVVGGGHKAPPKSEAIEYMRVVRVKNYNQYNMTLQKLTGLNRSRYANLFESIKGSLPADNNISGMTSFNLIAMSRLADAYCFDYVNEKMSADFFVANQEDRIIDHLFNTFLDQTSDNDPDYYATLRTEISHILGNDDGNGGTLFPLPSGNVVQGNKNYTIAACMTILASPYVTLLE